MSNCGPGGNNVGWGTPLVANRAQPEGWTSILRAVPARPSAEGVYGVVTLANRTVVESGAAAVETVGLLRFGSGGAAAELEFDWIEGNQFSVAGSSYIELLAKVLDVGEETSLGTTVFPSAFVSWQTNRPANNASLQRSNYVTVPATGATAEIRVPPLATSYYVLATNPLTTMALLRVQGSASRTFPTTSQTATVTAGAPIPLAARTRYVRLVNADVNDAAVVFVWVYAL